MSAVFATISTKKKFIKEKNMLQPVFINILSGAVIEYLNYTVTVVIIKLI